MDNAHRFPKVTPSALRDRAAPVMFEAYSFSRTGNTFKQVLDFGIIDCADLVCVIEVHYGCFMMVQFKALTIERQFIRNRASVMNRNRMGITRVRGIIKDRLDDIIGG